SFSTYPTLTTQLTVSSAQLDGLGNFVKTQALRGNMSVNVGVSSADTTIGTVSPKTVTIPGGSVGNSTTFTAVAVGSTNVSVATPTGFSTPAQDVSVSATVNPAGLIVADDTVGNNLETQETVNFQGVAPAGTQVLVTSNSPQLKLSTTATGVGANSIAITLSTAASHTPPFFVYGFSNSGTATYTASANGFTAGIGTITMVPSGVVISGPSNIGAGGFQTSTISGTTKITVYTAQLDGSGNYLNTQALAGGLNVTVNLSNSNSSVGSLASSSLPITPGTDRTSTTFTPLNVGSTTITAGVPSGFSTPVAADQSVTATVSLPGLTVFNSSIGQFLENGSTITLAVQPPQAG